MEFIIIPLSALLASTLTFFSGCGLGTILLPTFALFFKLEIAICLTGIVHFLNNVFKSSIIGKSIHWKTFLFFGAPAFIGAFIGANLLNTLSDYDNQIHFKILNYPFETSYINITISGVMLFFAIAELIPAYKKMAFNQNKLPLGGLLSGFFGGLSGHQGALRSAFLIKVNLTKMEFIATGVAIAMVVDLSRLTLYLSNINHEILANQSSLLLVAILSAFIGAIVGKKLLQKITIAFLHTFVAIMIMIIAILTGLGVI